MGGALTKAWVQGGKSRCHVKNILQWASKLKYRNQLLFCACPGIGKKGSGLVFSVKGQMINILGSAGQTVSVEIPKLCYYSINEVRQYVNIWVWLCSNKALFTKTGSRPDLPVCLEDPCRKHLDQDLLLHGRSAQKSLV